MLKLRLLAFPFLFSLLYFIIACNKKSYNHSKNTIYFSKSDTTLYDASRSRKIPVLILSPSAKITKKLIIISHGYGVNKGGDYLKYMFMNEHLAQKGYTTISIQHELETDSLLAMTGKPQVTRRSNWERGADNIKFVIEEYKRLNPNLKINKIVLIGHSNGGDMSMLFGHKYPSIASKIISFDNRRMAFPVTSSPRIYSMRSNDYPADEGVIPSIELQQKHNMLVEYSNINHGQMDEKATVAERETILMFIDKCLNGR